MTNPPHGHPRDMSVLIAGTVRNCARTIERSLDALIAATEGFARSEVLIIESDSSDGTAKILDRLAGRGTIAFESHGDLRQRISLRTERIAYCRNRIVEQARTRFADVDYVLLADFDGVNDTVSRTNLECCFSCAVPWDALTANQRRYYDIYALRHPDWSPGDCVEQASRLAGVFGARAAKSIAIRSKQVHLPTSAAPLEVDSAFGGLALYRAAAFRSGTYVGAVNGNEVCEHVTFHAGLRELGFRIFINPAMLNGVPAEHSPHAWRRWIAAQSRKWQAHRAASRAR